MNKFDLTGQKFHRLTVIEPDGKSTSGEIMWRCQCDCGKTVSVTTNHLRHEHTKSCGCLNAERNRTRIAEYRKRYFRFGTHLGMLRRTKLQPNNTSGHTGVKKAGDKWCAVIGFQGKRHWLGRYDKYEDAVAARQKAEKELWKPVLLQAEAEAQEKGSET